MRHSALNQGFDVRKNKAMQRMHESSMMPLSLQM